jgi:alcohol dehydrogenase class IV
MIAPITLNLPATIEFGAGKIETLRDHLAQSDRVFVLVDPPILPAVQPLLNELSGTGMAVEISTEIVPEPPIETLENLLAPVREFGPDTVIGIGGGSTMDLAKLVAVLFTGEQQVADVIGIGNVRGRRVKLITASTTSGTGSEVTPIAVLTDKAEKLKKGVVSPHIVPDVAIVDPALTVGMPPAITASTGMDAMTHCIEAFTNRHAHPMIDDLALSGIRLIAANLETAVRDGENLEARTAMALGSMYGGMCLGPVNTAAVHALAYPLGGTFGVAHGVSNSVLLPFVMAFNLPECIAKYAKVGRAMGLAPIGDENSMAQAAIEGVRDLSGRCGIPGGLRELNIPETAVPDMSDSAMAVTRLLANNPREVTRPDAEKIFRAAFGESVEF